MGALSREIKRSWRNPSIPLETQAEAKSCGHKANSVHELAEGLTSRGKRLCLRECAAWAVSNKSMHRMHKFPQSDPLTVADRRL